MARLLTLMAAAILGLTSAQMVAAVDRRQEEPPADDLKGLIGWLKANPDTASVGIG